MSLAAIRTKGKLKPPIIVLYGTGGIGKTTFAASMGKNVVKDSEGNIIAENVTKEKWSKSKAGVEDTYPKDSKWSGSHGVIIVQCEDGIGKIECNHFDVAKTYKEFMDNLLSLLNEDHEYKTVAVDSLDWLEKLMKTHVCEENGWGDISQPAFGKGFTATLKLWEEYLEVLNRLRDEKNMTVLQIAHNEIKRIEDPTNDPHDKMQIKLYRKAADLVVEHADCVFFANYKIGTVQVKGKNGAMSTRTVAGDRKIFTQEAPGFQAKNRYGLPSEMPFEWAAIREEMLK